MGSSKGAQLLQAYIAASGTRFVPAMWRHARLERPCEVAGVAGQQYWRTAINQIGDVVIRVTGYRDRQNDPSPKTSTLGPKGAIAGAAEKSMLENFDLPEKWFATAARAKKLASALPKINSVCGASAGTPAV